MRRSYADRVVDHAARMTFDHGYDGTGNWPFNTAYAARHTGHAFVTRFRSLRGVERFIRAGIPVVTSITFARGQLRAHRSAPATATCRGRRVHPGRRRGGQRPGGADPRRRPPYLRPRAVRGRLAPALPLPAAACAARAASPTSSATPRTRCRRGPGARAGDHDRRPAPARRVHRVARTVAGRRHPPGHRVADGSLGFGAAAGTPDLRRPLLRRAAPGRLRVVGLALPEVETGFPATELVPSWNATTPGDSWLLVEARTASDQGRVVRAVAAGRGGSRSRTGPTPTGRSTPRPCRGRSTRPSTWRPTCWPPTTG